MAQKILTSFMDGPLTKKILIDIPRSWSRNLLEANCSTKELLEISTDCGFGFEKA